MFPILTWSAVPVDKRKTLFERSGTSIADVIPRIRPWVERIRLEGDVALVDYVRRFDDPAFTINRLRVSRDEIEQAYRDIDPPLLEAIRREIMLCRTFQERLCPTQELTLREMIPGVLAGKRVTPIDSVGLYVPAGSAPLPTVMQILAVPAKIAGVERVVACMPPKGRVPAMLVAADIAGVDEIYCVGGVAAIAAMAYGTESIRSVAKIAGPGSVYVQAAKSLVRDTVAIDMIAGPSEVLIVADADANPRFAAADLLAQAEHDPNAAAVLVTDNESLAKRVQEEATKLLPSLTRQEILAVSMSRYSAIVLVDSMDSAVAFANKYAPEHLEILCADPWSVLAGIRNAGSIFLGPYAPVAAGDYATGTNNTLPTGSWVKTSSPISVRTFQKESEVQCLTKDGLACLRDTIKLISNAEGLDAHSLSVDVRFPPAA